MDNSRETLVKRAPRTIGLVWSAFGWRLWSKDDDLPDDPNAVRYVPASDLTRLNAKVEELEQAKASMELALNLKSDKISDLREFNRLAEAQVADLSARLARAVEVKALEWTDREIDDPEVIGSGARTSISDYWTSWDGREEKRWTVYLGQKRLPGRFEHERDAKAAAQSDFEQRIRSALVLSEQENPHG